MKLRLILFTFLLLSCDRDENCFCTETTTDIQDGTVFVDEYWLDNCNEPFTVLETYNWGNVVIDCR
jgi:hypothetical protein